MKKLADISFFESLGVASSAHQVWNASPFTFPQAYLNKLTQYSGSYDTRSMLREAIRSVPRVTGLDKILQENMSLYCGNDPVKQREYIDFLQQSKTAVNNGIRKWIEGRFGIFSDLIADDIIEQSNACISSLRPIQKEEEESPLPQSPLPQPPTNPPRTMGAEADSAPSMIADAVSNYIGQNFQKCFSICSSPYKWESGYNDIYQSLLQSLSRSVQFTSNNKKLLDDELYNALSGVSIQLGVKPQKKPKKPDTHFEFVKKHPVKQRQRYM